MNGIFIEENYMSEIADLVFQFFQLLDLKPIAIRKGIYQVHIDEQLAKQLDGWRAKSRLFQFTFDKKLSKTYGAELICRGSYRLDTIITLIRKKAVLSTGYLPHSVFYEPSIRRKILDRLAITNPECRWYVIDYQCIFGPYLWVTLSLTYLAYEKREELQKILIDLIDGQIVHHQIPADLLKSGHSDPKITYKRKLTFKQAYCCIQQEITRQLSYSDQTWAQIALEELEKERMQLEDYFKNIPDSQHQHKRIAELMNRAKPRVQVRPLRGALLFLPKLEYRVMQVGKQEKTNRIIYDPVSNNYTFS